MRFLLLITCEKKHRQSMTVDGYTREDAKVLAGIIDGTSPSFAISPREDPKSSLARCQWPVDGNACGALIDITVQDMDGDSSLDSISELVSFILVDIPGEPSRSDGPANVMMRMVREYQRITQGLWKIFDDISTASDACKSDDAAFRNRVYDLCERRSQFFVSDGQRLFRVNPEGVCPEPEPERLATITEAEDEGTGSGSG